MGNIPVAVDWDEIPVWRTGDSHSLEVNAERVTLRTLNETLKQILGPADVPSQTMGGQLDLQARFKGNLDAPKLDAYLDVEKLTWDAELIGDLVIGIQSDAEMMNLHAQVIQDKARYADVRASVPVTVNLASAMRMSLRVIGRTILST